jgi:hypothetical protein
VIPASSQHRLTSRNQSIDVCGDSEEALFVFLFEPLAGNRMGSIDVGVTAYVEDYCYVHGLNVFLSRNLIVSGMNSRFLYFLVMEMPYLLMAVFGCILLFGMILVAIPCLITMKGKWNQILPEKRNGCAPSSSLRLMFSLRNQSILLLIWSSGLIFMNNIVDVAFRIDKMWQVPFWINPIILYSICALIILSYYQTLLILAFTIQTRKI